MKGARNSSGARPPASSASTEGVVHRHSAAEEIYAILRGTGCLKLDDELLEVRPLDAIRVDPEVALAFEAGREGLEFLAFGPHHPGDGEPVDDASVE